MHLASPECQQLVTGPITVMRFALSGKGEIVPLTNVVNGAVKVIHAEKYSTEVIISANKMDSASK